MSSFPTGVAVVTTVDSDGRPRGMTCSSLSSVSLDPPILSVCLAVTSGTLSSLRAHGLFGVNLLGDSASPVARLFADSSQNHFERVLWYPAGDSGVPRLDGDVVAFASCEVVDTKLVGDHVVIFGELVGIEGGAGTPLLYGRRQFVAWPGGAQAEEAGRPVGQGGPAVSPLPPAG
ncbi:flavin reductase family protein [Streptomyces sp. NPDC005925]|uniref:flavin reductase family protein n=1 Tax=Streptomyces sp. NPDC005925 TaxID=3157172 RepID=UPI0033D180F8